MANTIRVGYVCDSNPFEDRTAWSGLNYKIRESIENAGCEVVWIDCCPNGKVSKLCKLWNEFWHGKSTMFEHTRFFFRLRANKIDRKLVDNCDILFFPRRAQVISFMRCEKPIIYYSDATFSLLCGYYWNNLSNWQYKTGNELESKAIKHSRINLRASNWAASSVINEYGFSSDHTYVLRFGANLEDEDITPIQPYSGKGRVNILFSGVDWKRKGAEIAIQTVEILNHRGIDARLLMVGIMDVPKDFHNNPFIENIGYLNKSVPEQYQKYIQTLRKSHLFLLPTCAECAGIVFGECSAFGIPIYTYDTGGIGDYVFNNKNGFMLPLEAGPMEFAEIIATSLSPEKQRTLHDGCLEVYRDKLSWRVWSDTFGRIIYNEFCLGENINQF